DWSVEIHRMWRRSVAPDMNTGPMMGAQMVQNPGGESESLRHAAPQWPGNDSRKAAALEQRQAREITPALGFAPMRWASDTRVNLAPHLIEVGGLGGISQFAGGDNEDDGADGIR